ncbi:MAG: hypothetical protein EXS16_02265 [Gemmataceae bacterium]|nr:hypothetical protein [Gemmataceae bacterium]
MLEHPSLRLRQWSKSADTEGEPTWLRPIADADGKRLGAVRLRGVPASSWFSWLRSARLNVVEGDDDSELMQMRQSWSLFNVWELSDAEDMHVGSVYARTLISSVGDCLAYVSKVDSTHVRIVDPAGIEIAGIRVCESNTVELTFNATQTTNPFLRMMLLACAIAMDPAPKPM